MVSMNLVYIVLRSLFPSDVTVLLAYGKAKTGSTHGPDLTRKCLTGINDTLPKYKMIIINSMSIVDVIPMTQIIKTCNDFAQVFLDQLSNMAGDYDEVRLVPISLSKNK